jgi:hypothetical protein
MYKRNLCDTCEDNGKIRGHWFSLWRDTTCPSCKGDPFTYRHKLKKSCQVTSTTSRIYRPSDTTPSQTGVSTQTTDNSMDLLSPLNPIGLINPLSPYNILHRSDDNDRKVERVEPIEDSRRDTSWSSDSHSTHHSSYHSSHNDTTTSSSWGSSDSSSSYDSGSSSYDSGSSSSFSSD